jgi:hypothetical protein
MTRANGWNLAMDRKLEGHAWVEFLLRVLAGCTTTTVCLSPCVRPCRTC